MSDKRNRFLGVRVSETEYSRLLERCDGKQLAAWMRQTCLDERPARSGKLPTLAPALLRQLAGMGNNLNQIARKINGGQWSGHDRVQAVAALMAIDAGLERLRHAVREPEGDDDR
ncbi:MobC family plasmid mobilization relaxosome protein (plasmid) [Yersinia sp. HM-2024]|uniref:MobC family plasmid mobilization relaxosome protein n=1 Tax=Yersinia sp. HM-2024 TaxID=3344550 RepID=UPI00370D6D5D